MLEQRRLRVVFCQGRSDARERDLVVTSFLDRTHLVFPFRDTDRGLQAAGRGFISGGEGRQINGLWLREEDPDATITHLEQLASDRNTRSFMPVVVTHDSAPVWSKWILGLKLQEFGVVQHLQQPLLAGDVLNAVRKMESSVGVVS